MRTDIKSAVSPAQTIVPAAYTATQTGTGVDLANFDSAAVVLHFGAVANSDFTFEVQESDDDGDQDAYTAVGSELLEGSLPMPDADAVAVVGYHGIKRYVRVVATSGGAGDAVFGVSVLRAGARRQPA